MQTFEDFERWANLQGGQTGLSRLLFEKLGVKVGQSAISAWFSKRKIPEDRREQLEELGWKGPWEWPKPEEIQVYQAGAAPYVPPFTGPQGPTGPWLGPGWRDSTLVGFPTSLESLDRMKEAAKVVLKALHAEGLQDLDPKMEEWLIDQYADGLAAGRTRQLLDERLARALELLREHRQGKGAE
jgi:hypothetical protein